MCFTLTIFNYKNDLTGSSHHCSVETNLTRIHEMQVQSLALLSGLRIQHCCELWCRLKMQLGSCVAVAVV